MPRPDRKWQRFHGTISPAAKKYIKEQARDLKVELGTALDVVLWRNCLRPSDEALKPAAKPSQEILERSFGEDALDALLDPRAIRLLEDKLFPPEKPLGGKQRETQALLKRWRRFRVIDAQHKLAVREVMLLLGKIPTIEEKGAVDAEWFVEDLVSILRRESPHLFRRKPQ
jgi:hypothetical protein